MIAPRKILAIKLRSLGDTVLMTAPLSELKKAWPGAEIHVAVISRWAPLIESHPAVSKVWLYERHKETTSRAKAVARLALQLRRERYDCVVNFHASPSSATLAFATGAGVRSIHFHGHKDKNRYSTVVVPGKGVLKPIIERDMDVIRALGLNSPSGILPKLCLRDEEIKAAAERNLHVGLPGPLLAMGIGSSRPTKGWSVERFAALSIGWCRETGGSTVCYLGHEEDLLARDFLKYVDEQLMASIPDLSLRASIRARIACEVDLPLREMAAAVASAALYAGNDSGPKHIAVATGTPTVTVFGPEDPFEWHPYPQDLHAYLHVEGMACRRDALPGMKPWCGLHVCIEEKHRCMTEIRAEQVLAKCLELYKRTAILSASPS